MALYSVQFDSKCQTSTEGGPGGGAWASTEAGAGGGAWAWLLQRGGLVEVHGHGAAVGTKHPLQAADGCLCFVAPI